MLNQDALADDFATILGYRTSHAGLVLGASGAARTQNWVRFTRANTEYLTNSAVSGLSDTDGVTFAGWVNLKEGDAGATSPFIRFDNGTSSTICTVARSSANKLLILLGSSVPTTVFQVLSTGSYVIATGPFHLFVSARRTGGAWEVIVYVDGAVIAMDAPTTNVDTTCGLSAATRLRIGSSFTPGTTTSLGAEVSDFYFVAQYLDASNVSKFYSSGWVSLGDDGTASGAPAPLVYFGGPSRANTEVTFPALSINTSRGWQDGYNRGSIAALTATGTLKNAPGKVRFTATATERLLKTGTLTGQPANVTSLTAVVRFRHIANGTSQVFLRGYHTVVDTFPAVAVNIAMGLENRLGISGRDASAVVLWGRSASLINPTNGTLFVDGDEYILAVSLNGSTGALDVWHYSLATKTWAENSSTIGTAPTANMACSADLEWVIGSTFTGDATYLLNAELSYITLAMATDTSAFIDLTSAGVRANLLGAPSGWGVSNLIQFGIQNDGTHDHAATWAAGTNRGSGGAFSVPGLAVADV